MNISKERKIFIFKFVLFIILFTILIVLIHINYNDVKRKESLESTINNIMSLSEKQIFSIDTNYLYSSAYATNNVTNKSMWDLNVYQYTDIALYISSNSDDSDKNTIKSLYIDNIDFKNISSGMPSLYYKNISEFGKFNLVDTNLITDKLDFNIVDEITDTSLCQIDSKAISPITLEFVNLVKSNFLVSDIENPLVYDGSLLKRTNVSLSTISGSFSFDINIINNLDEIHSSTVTIDIPLKDNNTTIFDGSFSTQSNKKFIFYIK